MPSDNIYSGELIMNVTIEVSVYFVCFVQYYLCFFDIFFDMFIFVINLFNLVQGFILNTLYTKNSISPKKVIPENV